MKLLRAVSSGGGGGGGGTVTQLLREDKVALATVFDFDPATASVVAGTPLGIIEVFVDGVEIEIGNAVKTKEAYFSSDGGTTAKAWGAATTGDVLYWVGSVSGYQLDITQKIRYLYASA
jgi:hypothetical protein